MARVTVTFEEYQEGRFPPVCVISGRPADAILTQVTPIDAPTTNTGVLGRFERAARSLDVRRPESAVFGRLPVDSETMRALSQRHAMWVVLHVASIVVAVAALIWAREWSAPVFAAAVVGAVVARRRRRDRSRALPKVESQPDRTWIHLDGVSPEFATAIDRRGAERGRLVEPRSTRSDEEHP